MTPLQCRLARELNGWSPRDLAEAAAVPVEIVDLFEAGRLEGWAGLELDMRATLESQGFVFTRDDGVAPQSAPAQPRRIATQTGRSAA